MTNSIRSQLASQEIMFLKSYKSALSFSLLSLFLCTTSLWAQTTRWTEQKADGWYSKQPWLVGSNYVPRSAINELEMWQQETFDPAQIEQEFTWAESLGVNTMRVAASGRNTVSTGGSRLDPAVDGKAGYRREIVQKVTPLVRSQVSKIPKTGALWLEVACKIAVSVLITGVEVEKLEHRHRHGLEIAKPGHSYRGTALLFELFSAFVRWTTLISNSLGHSFPVTNNRSPLAS